MTDTDRVPKVLILEADKKWQQKISWAVHEAFTLNTVVLDNLEVARRVDVDDIDVFIVGDLDTDFRDKQAQDWARFLEATGHSVVVLSASDPIEELIFHSKGRFGDGSFLLGEIRNFLPE